MFTLLKRLSRFEIRVDTEIERFLFHHRLMGFLMIFIGIPMITLLAVCLFAAVIAFPLSLLFSWFS